MVRWLAAVVVACSSFPDPGSCRWLEDGRLDIDWQAGEECRAYCAVHPFKFSPTDPADPDYVTNECRTTDCYRFSRDHTQVQVWRDPTAGFAANLGAEDWWTEPCP